MPHQETEQFLARLFRAGLRVSAKDEQLRISGAKGAMTPELADEIKQRKTDVLMFLSEQSVNPAPDRIPCLKSAEPPLSQAQTRLWIIEQMNWGQPIHNISFTIEARGSLDVDAVQYALDAIVQRHAVLRTRISSTAGVATQSVNPEVSVPIRRIDARSMDENEIRHRLSELTTETFDLSCQAPLRLVICEREPDQWLLVFTLHHIAGDGGSIELLIGKFSALYALGSAAELPDLPLQYGDFAAWQNARPETAARDKFWQQELGQDIPVTQLTTDYPRPPIRSGAGAIQAVLVDAETTSALQQLAREQGASLFATMFAAFNILLSRYTGQGDLIVGTPTANRPDETERLIGLFVNPLPVRSRVDMNADFRTNLAAFKDHLWQVLEHQDIPFETLVDRFVPARDPSITPLFQVKFQLDTARQERIRLPGVDLKVLPRNGGIAHHDLSLNLVESDSGLRGEFEYSTDLFKPETIAALTANFATLLSSILADPDKPVGQLDLLPPETRHRQLIEWNSTAQAFDPNACFQQMFEAHVHNTPDAIAVEFVAEGQVVTETYGQLNARANRLAHWLCANGAKADTIIGISLDRSPDLVAAWLAVLKSGAAYLPLDPAYPSGRLAYMIEDSGAELVLTHSDVELPETVHRVELDQNWPDGSEENPEFISTPQDLAYLVYTSGSTGRPKGVQVPHAGIVNLVLDKIRTCDVWPGDRVIHFFSFSFDAVLPEFTMALGSGSRIVLTPAEDVLPGPGLGQLLRDRRITHITLTPSALLAVPVDEYPDLRMVLVGGEAPSADLVERWAPGRLFINGYGPTETTVNASMVACSNGMPTEATLRPAANKQLYVLDENLQPLPVGCLGELYIGGVGLARGYHNRPEKTAEVFLPNPFGSDRIYKTGDRAQQLPDGRIRVLGRIDNQCKIRGYRVELGEIEQVILDHPAVASAIVTVAEVKPGDQRLVAYVVASGSRPDPEGFRRDHIGAHLPRFLQPDVVIWLDELPLTVNSKVDMSALPVPSFAIGQGRAVQGKTEEILARIFTELLEVKGLSAEDDFFDLGGHSLLATRLTAAIEDQLGVKITILDLFNAPSVAALARHIAKGHSVNLADWQADLALDPALDFAQSEPACGVPDRVFLTGATGFLGAYLLAELLEDPLRHVWCLTRTKGLDRIRSVLDGYDLWQTGWEDRIHPVTGDLSKPRLGISDRDYAEILNTGMILHCAADVHHMKPYRALRDANVAGTVEILRLAAAGEGRPLHYLSTLSGLANPDKSYFDEQDRMVDQHPPKGGYNLSKWVAEQLVQQAAGRGLPVSIYRVGSVSGHSETGHFNRTDILARLLQGYLTSGIAPEGETLINVVPVDHAVALITTLAAQPTGQTWHITHPHPVSSQLLFDACASEGHDLTRVSQDIWRDHLAGIARTNPDHPLFALTDLAANFTATHDWPFDCAATLSASGFRQPPLNEALFRTYLQAFASAGAVPSPDKKEKTA